MENFRRELTRLDLERMRIPERYWDATLGLVSDTRDSESPRGIVSKYLAKIDELYARGVGLFLWGNNGLGKTCASVVIGKEYRRRGRTVLFMPAAKISAARIQNDMFDSDQSIWDRCSSVDVLLLDDLGKGSQDNTGFGKRILDELVRDRSSRRKVTFITTNMQPGEQLGDALKESTLASLKECIVPVQFEGPDLRDAAVSEIRQMLAMEG